MSKMYKLFVSKVKHKIIIDVLYLAIFFILLGFIFVQDKVLLKQLQ